MISASLPPARQELARQLTALLADHTPTAIGQALAEMQPWPERKGVPFDRTVVQAWLDGAQHPPQYVFDGLKKLIGPVSDPEILDYLYHAAKPRVTMPTTEVSLMLQARLREKWLQNTDKRLDDKQCAADELLAFCKAEVQAAGIHQAIGLPLITSWIHGTRPVPMAILPLLDRFLPPTEAHAPSFVAVARHMATQEQYEHYQKLNAAIGPATPAIAAQEKTGTNTLQAANQSAPCFYRCLSHLRQSRAMTLPMLQEEIAARLPLPQFAPSAALIRHWEEPPNGPSPSRLPTRATLQGRDPLEIYGEIMAQYGMGQWFTAHQATLRQAYDTAIATRSPTYNRYTMSRS